MKKICLSRLLSMVELLLICLLLFEITKARQNHKLLYHGEAANRYYRNAETLIAVAAYVFFRKGKWKTVQV